MNEDILKALAWLPEPPADIRQRARSATRAEPPDLEELRRLASYRLDENALSAVGNALGRAISSSSESKVKLGLLSDTTTDYLRPALLTAAARHGLLLDLYVGAFGQIEQEVFTTSSPLTEHGPNIVFLSLDVRNLGLDRPRLEEKEREALIEGTVARIRSLQRGINDRLGATAILSTLVPPSLTWSGSADRNIPGSPHEIVEAINGEIRAMAAHNGNVLLDVDLLSAMVGRVNWSDAPSWYRAKIPFALDYLSIYAEHIARLLGALKGRSRKCLVLDLDNTLWGGIVGDEGLDGIRIGQGSAEGEAHLAVQSFALACRERGIVLAVCSKNEMSAAIAPFREHKEMLLREEHIAVFRANWEDKASNLAYIAKALNIGVDALVFVDDNPAEREQVRQTLPEVAVPELPNDPALFAITVAAAGYFEALTLSPEDRRRAESYRTNPLLSMSMDSISDMDAYLKSLDMRLEALPFNEIGTKRIAQLINKSNQYNLTTRRYSELDVRNFSKDPELFTLQLRLFDKFGDNGMISVIVFRRGPVSWVCDTWLMSCRVLGRRVEEAALQLVVDAAKRDGASTLVGHYIPSPKNAMVKNHFEKLGFHRVSESADGSVAWELDLASSGPAADIPIAIDHSALMGDLAGVD